jgi:HK97 family phage major capsid protein
VPEDSGAGGNNNGSIRNKNDSADNFNQRETASMDKILRDAKGNLVRAKVDDQGTILEVLEVMERAEDSQNHVQRGRQSEADRTRQILEMGEQYKMDDLARSFVKDGKSVAEFQRAALDQLNTRSSKPLNEQFAEAGVGLSDKEVREYSFMRVIRALANPQDKKAQQEAAFEMEASRAAADKLGKEAQGIMVPADVLSRSFTAGTDTATAGHTGGFGVPTTLLSESFIDILRHKATIMKLGFIMGGLVGNFDIPRQSAHGQGYWLGEDVDATESNIDIDQVHLAAKTVGAYTDITRKLMQQNSIGAELLVRRDLAISLGLTIDTAGYYGTGSANNQPQGIAGITGIEAVDWGVAGTLPSWAQLVQMETTIAAADADVDAMTYVMNANMRGHCKTTQKFPTTPTGATIWEPGNTVNGYATAVTNQINDGDVFFGNFANLIVALWGGLDLFVDPYSKSKSGGIRVVAFQDVDYAVRHPQSFCLGRATG